MLSKRIIPCLDVKNGKVVKGTRFRDHEILGDILELAKLYTNSGADELVFYDITASPERRSVAAEWVTQIAEIIDIPFCVAGGIRNVDDARIILNAGADKVSINSPALENPRLISELAREFGSQCVVVGIDSMKTGNDYVIYKNTGSPDLMAQVPRRTLDWIVEVQERGAGEVVLNCMNQDGVGRGYDLEQLKLARSLCRIPLVASGGAGNSLHFAEVFREAKVDAALAAGVFHRREVEIPALKKFLAERAIAVRAEACL